ncbi:hypothetical protein A2316_02825 [Candidatus Falkowbacteria bacterium RIFOXYB2_FULL_38_15]|uniref:UDP-N-acetylmuramyl-tripeptide synthetase n=1 Tax=Candidatus Falkowbacteria bacterium RIFOXYA2_FULL_38_12 TaxID=1797993 RepID=A0A1F5S391_9BACT|nr:MAG: hypothetical protein A2257_00210 [Candidatus Falkowbacteria bacterium RIFOXYA2_FULL_38_12]OGF32178.1 MAG: hypothetical protein A2316_02825 [Candidatus Falkowbacteria bacterium RIFOXYB2_FULL_38_15]OGF42779.1 MAG: hypothetical protein A2555_04360 [Candidatus Falkowbacteria bacterium RIFOXYD2_FULL_39_16]
MKELLKKILPESFILAYHYFLSVLAVFIYGFPSRKMVVIGVTGTKGKTSTANFIWACLNAGGKKTGIITTANIRIGEDESLNNYHMTMPGRFSIQKTLAKMVKAGCKFCVVETTSQGIRQYRHIGVDYDFAVFTNLTPEHISAHKDFSEYKKMKGKMFATLAQSKVKKIDNHGAVAEWSFCQNLHILVNFVLNFLANITILPQKFITKFPQNLKIYDQKTIRRQPHKKIEKTIIVNFDSEHKDYFLDFASDKRITYGLEGGDFVAKIMEENDSGVKFQVGESLFKINILGKFNVYNTLPAIIIARIFDIKDEAIGVGLLNLKIIPGRMEEINEGQNFKLFIDYAHEKASMTGALLAVNKIKKEGENKIIVLLGAEGGGRDKTKRFEMGEVAAKMADYVIASNVDPYNDDPREIVEDIVLTAEKFGKIRNENLFLIEDRREGIKKTITLAKSGDIVLITGKGAEQTMIIGGKTIPWDDRVVAREELRKYLRQ